MKERYASIIEQLKWIPISYRHDGLQGIINELRLFTGKSVRYKGKLRLLTQPLQNTETTKKRWRESDLLYKSYDGKGTIHFGENNPWNRAPKFIQMKLRARGIFQKHILSKVGKIKKNTPSKEGVI